MLQEEVLCGYARLREPDQPGLLAARRRQVPLDPGRQLLGHEGLVAEMRMARIIGVPGIDGECGLNYRQVISILYAECSHGLEAIPISGTLPWADPEHDK